MALLSNQTQTGSHQFEEAQGFLLEKLERELPDTLHYHDVQHTREVMEAVSFLCQEEGVGEKDRMLLLTAALFHDSGFLEGYANHEELSCEVARRHLPRFGYTAEEITQICKLIMVTKLPQTPTNHLERILCDADLFYLGTESYEPVAENLYRELRSRNLGGNRKTWEKTQIQFLKSHLYFTQTARRLREEKKKANLSLLLQKASEGKAHTPDHITTNIQDLFLILCGVILAGFALKGFLVPNHFFDGGVTGFSLLIHELYHFNLAYVILLANLPFIIASYFQVSPKFAYKTFFCVLLLGICLLFFPYPTITHDKLLISIFGGFFLGVGVGLIMRAGCAIDGIEVLALYTLRRTSFTITEIILGINVLIFGIAAFKFGPETALYSALTYFTATRTIDYVVEGIQAYTGVTVISGHSEIIKHRLVNELGRGITVYKGERGFLPNQFHVSAECDIIFTIVTRLELRKLKNLVYEVDPKAFVFANTIKEASGGIIKRRAAH